MLKAILAIGIIVMGAVAFLADALTLTQGLLLLILATLMGKD